VIVLFSVTAELAQAALGGDDGLAADTVGGLGDGDGVAQVADVGTGMGGSQGGHSGGGLGDTGGGVAAALAAGARVSFHLALQLGCSVALGAAAAAAMGRVRQLPRNGAWKHVSPLRNFSRVHCGEMYPWRSTAPRPAYTLPLPFLRLSLQYGCCRARECVGR
jgi:hypothetical protein